MFDRFSWPEFDKAGAFQFHKVINEPDFLPLYFVRHIAQTGTLLRKHKGHLKISPAGRRMLQPPNPRALQAVLFHITMWHFDLGNLGWGLHGWPQRDAGVILWSLSIASNDWQPRERLSRLCTIPINGVLDQTWDTASHAMEARILRPLQWFGLLEHREENTDGDRFGRRHLYRKTALFDRFLSFDVTLEKGGTTTLTEAPRCRPTAFRWRKRVRRGRLPICERTAGFDPKASLSQHPAGAQAAIWSSTRRPPFDNAKSRLTTRKQHVVGNHRLSEPLEGQRTNLFGYDASP
jgi:hypothetical protein